MKTKIPNGYILLARLIFESPIWRDDPHILKLFIYLVGQARHNKTPKKYPNVTIKRGELVTSLSQIAEDNEYVFNNGIRKWSRAKVSRMIKVLEKQGYIDITSDTYGTHLKVCNYDNYQTASNYTSNSFETTMKQPCNNHETTMKTNKNVKNVKNEKNEKKVTTKKTTFKKPTLSEWIDHFYSYATSFYEDDFPISKIKCKSLAINSYDYWEDKKWLRKGKPMKSWKRTIETKVRRENTKLKDWKKDKEQEDMLDARNL